ncbi:hypothetical protein [Saccharopolyspora halophila]
MPGRTHRTCPPYPGARGHDFEILDAPELTAATARLAERCRLAAEGASGAW